MTTHFKTVVSPNIYEVLPLARGGVLRYSWQSVVEEVSVVEEGVVDCIFMY